MKPLHPGLGLAVLGLLSGHASARQATPAAPRHFILQSEGSEGRVVAISSTVARVAVAAAGEENIVVLFDVLSHRQLRRIPLESAAVAMAFSPDDTQLFVGTESGTIEVWAADSERRVRTLARHTNSIEDLAFSRDGGQLRSVSADGTVISWNLATGRPVQVTPHPLRRSEEMLGAAISAGGEWLVESVLEPPDGARLQVWNLLRRSPVRSLEPPYEPIEAVAISPDGRWVAVGTTHSHAYILDTTTGKSIHQLETNGWAERVAFSPDGRTLAVGTLPNNDPRELEVFDVASGRSLWKADARLEFVRSLAFSADGRALASVSDDGSTRIWDAATGRETWFEAPYNGDQGGQGVAFSPDGRLLATASEGSRIRVWATDTWSEAAPFRSPLSSFCGAARTVTFSPDGKFMVARYACGPATVWDVETRQPVDPSPASLLVEVPPPDSTEAWKISRSCVSGMAKSRDGRWLACAAYTEKAGLRVFAEPLVIVLNATTRDIVRRFAGHTQEVAALAFSPDGRWLVSGARDRSVRVWDVGDLPR